MVCAMRTFVRRELVEQSDGKHGRFQRLQRRQFEQLRYVPWAVAGADYKHDFGGCLLELGYLPMQGTVRRIKAICSCSAI